MNLPLASIGNLLGPDSLIIFLFILLLFGAKKLPELARGMGQAVREFSKAKDEIEREVTRPPEPAVPAPAPRALYEPRVEDVKDVVHHDPVQEVARQDLPKTAPHGDPITAPVPQDSSHV